MAKTLKATPQELTQLFVLTTHFPPSKITKGEKLSTFKRAFKLTLDPYWDGQTKIVEVFQKDKQEYTQKQVELSKKLTNEKDEEAKKVIQKELDELKIATDKLKEEENVELQKYADSHKEEVTLTFDNEAFLYVKDLFSECAGQMFGQFMKNKEGEIIREYYDSVSADKLFDLLNQAK
jgi:protein subunit release factor A